MTKTKKIKLTVDIILITLIITTIIGGIILLTSQYTIFAIILFLASGWLARSLVS